MSRRSLQSRSEVQLTIRRVVRGNRFRRRKVEEHLNLHQTDFDPPLYACPVQYSLLHHQLTTHLPPAATTFPDLSSPFSHLPLAQPSSLHLVGTGVPHAAPLRQQIRVGGLSSELEGAEAIEWGYRVLLDPIQLVGAQGASEKAYLEQATPVY